MTLSRSPDHGDTATALMRRGGVGIADLPGFEASLRLLLERERYSVTDIALMFGVSRERMRQLCERLDLRHPDGKRVGLNCLRVWDDRSHQFCPVSRHELTTLEERARRSAQRSVRMAHSATRQASRRERIATALNDLRKELRREPSWPEFAQRVLGRPSAAKLGCATILAQWDSRSRDAAEKLRALRDATGYVPHAVGRPRGSRLTHCGQCGAEWRVTPSGIRYCPKQKKHRALRAGGAS